MGQVKMKSVRFSQLGGISLYLITIDGQLDLFSAGYALQRYDSAGKLNTVKKDSQVIMHLYQFCIEQGIDLIARIASQSPISMGEIESFSAYCSANRDTGEQVDSAYYGQRMRIAWKYIKWLWLFYQNRTKVNLDNLKASKLQFTSMEAAFNLYLKSPYRTDKVDRIGLTPELRVRFFDIINPLPENELNPWKSDKVRWRNYALLLTMILGGNRKGESLLLKLNHFALSGRRKYFEVVKQDRNELPEAYPRVEAPSVKTFGRQIELADIMAGIFEHYLTEWRGKFKNADQSMYMFLSARDGLPLSVRTPNALLTELIKKHQEFKGLLSPHRLRNTFHDLLNEALDEKHQGESAFSKKLNKAPLQEYAGGWKAGSQMTHHYPKGSIQRKMADMHQQLQTVILADKGDI